MDDLRTEIRAAFEKEQAAHPPVAGLRSTLAAAAASQARPAQNLQWLAVAVAALLGILVVAGLMSTRLAHRVSVPVPAATPLTIPTGDYGQPPAGVNLLYVRDPTNPSWLIGLDWTGKPRATVKLAQPLANQQIAMAPDGQQFQVNDINLGGGGPFLDRLGRPIPGGGVPGTASYVFDTGLGHGIWADDNRRFCSAVQNQHTFAWTLETQLPGQAPKTVTLVTREPGVQSIMEVVACSFRSDEAILVRTKSYAEPAEIWVIRLSNGRVLSHSVYPIAQAVANVVASSDATYIAESSGQSIGQVSPPPAPATVIRRVSDRSVVATLAPNITVLSFSGDDSLVLVSTGPYGAWQPSVMEVIDVRSGRVIWHGTAAFGGVVAQPGGRDFALVDAAPGMETVIGSILIIHGDGSVTKFAGHYVASW